MLAKKLLCIQGGSVAAERVFSHAGSLISAKRSSLDHELVDQLIFLNKNSDPHAFVYPELRQ